MLRATRDAIGKALLEIGDDQKVVVIDNDIGGACKTDLFKEKYPERYFNVGIAEQEGAALASGLATTNKIPFVVSFACFASMRMLETIRQEICYPNLNVKIIGSHAGLTTASNGASHQSIEDYGIFRSIPNMVIIMASDYNSAIFLTKEAYKYKGPVYLRYTRSELEDIYDEKETFEIGKAKWLKEGKDVSIIANGDTVNIALRASDLLKEKGISSSVLDMHTIKPIDKDAIIKCIETNGKIITIEDHNVIGGLGSACSEVIAEYGKGIIRRVGIDDKFGKCGSYEELLKDYDITEQVIVEKALDII